MIFAVEQNEGGNHMTNREKLKSLVDDKIFSDRKLGALFCSFILNCDYCKMRKKCSWFRSDGFLKWLEEEEEETT